jgi:hypothetical protein
MMPRFDIGGGRLFELIPIQKLVIIAIGSLNLLLLNTWGKLLMQIPRTEIKRTSILKLFLKDKDDLVDY